MLHHVGIEIVRADGARAVEFFELLGFERVEPPPALATGFAWLQRGGTQVHLMYEESSAVVPPRGHLAVVVDDYEETLTRLRAAGFEARPGREHWGVPRAQAVAPGGHRVELMAAPPVSTPYVPRA